MPRTLTPSDRSRLIKMASKMPIGAPERKAIVAGLSKSGSVLPKAFRVSPKEKARADRSVPGRPFTIISRPQSDGSYMVAAVDPDTGMLVFKHAVEYADDKRGVSDAVRRLNRHLDKNTGLSTEMTSRSRHQHKAAASYFDMFFKEKDIPYKVFDVKDSQGVTHMIPNEVVIEAIKGTRGSEKAKIEKTLRMIDFKDGDVNRYLEHLARGLAEQYSGALRFASGGQSMGVEKVKVASDSPVLMPVQGRAKEVMPANGTDFKLREVQKMVGGYVEVVYLRDGRIMLVDEEGLLKQLPINRAASLMAGRPIVGNALVMPNDMFR